jgi:hypothetical protein
MHVFVGQMVQMCQQKVILKEFKMKGVARVPRAGVQCQHLLGLPAASALGAMASIAPRQRQSGPDCAGNFVDGSSSVAA